MLQCYDPSTFLRGAPTLHSDAVGPAPPDTIGPFSVLHPVGAGALGPVFRAYDAERDRFVALKMFRLDLTPDRAHKVVGELETLIAAQVSHPSLATPLAAGLVDAAPYLVQDFVLADALDVVARQRGPLPPAEVTRLVAALAAGLDHAAARAVPHGGLHPRDVLMTASGPRTTGIGVVRALERVGLATPYRRPYVAPERTGGRSWDARADVFSLAAMAFELLWGRRLVGAGEQALAGARSITGADMRALQRVFTCALSDDPDGRFDKAGTFAEELRAAFVRPKTAAERLSFGLPHPDEGEPALSASPVTKAGRERRPRIEPEPSLPLEEKAEPANLDADSARPDRKSTLPEEKSAPANGRIEPPATDVAPAAEARLPVERSEMLTGLSPLSASDPRTDAAKARTSNVWPLVLALVLGLSVGFAGGYSVGSRETATVVTSPPLREALSSAEPPPPPVALQSPPAVPASPVEPRNPSVAVERQSQPAPPARPAGKGRVVVRSTPPGGRVFLDGREAGIAPLTLHDVAAGSHTIRVSLDGHVSVERRITTGPEKPSQAIAVELVAVRGRTREPDRSKPTGPTAREARVSQSAGSLQVDSRPTGANVFVDGKPIGKTPLLLESIEPGDHGVRLELDGYRSWQSSARITAGGRSRVAASLEP